MGTLHTVAYAEGKTAQHWDSFEEALERSSQVSMSSRPHYGLIPYFALCAGAKSGLFS